MGRVFLDMPWNFIDYRNLLAIARAHQMRKGHRDRTGIFFLVSLGPLKFSNSNTTGGYAGFTAVLTINVARDSALNQPYKTRPLVQHFMAKFIICYLLIWRDDNSQFKFDHKFVVQTFHSMCGFWCHEK